MKRRWHQSALVLCFGLVALGCSGGTKAEKTVQVSGTVKLDGKLLPDGQIMFVGPVGTVPDTLTITAGGFEGKVKVGKKKVEIRAFEMKKAPPTATAGVTEVKENYLPDRYNTNTQLTAEVTESGLTPDTFEVQRK
jgi:hypothetical protein